MIVEHLTFSRKIEKILQKNFRKKIFFFPKFQRLGCQKISKKFNFSKWIFIKTRRRRARHVWFSENAADAPQPKFMIFLRVRNFDFQVKIRYKNTNISFSRERVLGAPTAFFRLIWKLFCWNFHEIFVEKLNKKVDFQSFPGWKLQFLPVLLRKKTEKWEKFDFSNVCYFQTEENVIFRGSQIKKYKISRFQARIGHFLYCFLPKMAIFSLKSL